MSHDLHTLYDLTRSTRRGVLDWFGDLPEGLLAKRHDGFAYGSLAAIYAHVAATYLFWIGSVGLGDPGPEVRAETVEELREAFARVDATVARALEAFDDLDAPLAWTSPSTGRVATLTQRWLIWHPITHEFHHKGQALALARMLGHPHHGRPDTDLVEPGRA